MEQRSDYSRLLLTKLLLAGLLTLLSAVACTQAGAQFKITMSPELFPAFNQDISDYIVRAGPDDTVTVNVDAPNNVMVSVDGRPFAGQKFTAKIKRVATGQSFKMVVWSRQGGQPEWKTYYVRRVPSDFPTWTTERPGRPQSEFYVIAPNLFANKPWVIVTDNYGAPLWWYRSNSVPVDPKFLSKDRIGWMNFGPGEEHSLDGTLTHIFFPAAPIGGGMDPHEILHLPNGNYVYIVALWRGPVDLRPYGGLDNTYVLDNIVEEVAPNGMLVWSWSTFDHISVEETDPNWRFLLGSTFVDPYHMNSVERAGDTYVISLRHLNAVICVDRKTGDILWKLGGTPRKESLKYVGDTHSNFGGNHDARILPDGTLTLHDNGTTQGRPPRGVRFRIDAVARTATFVEQITDPNAPYSGFTGSVRKLSGGNWVTEWGGNPFVTELAPNGNLVFRMVFNGAFSYRASPVHFGYISRQDLRNGMNKQFPR